jgi:type II secretory pathway component GspD/PulD (secretin)
MCIYMILAMLRHRFYRSGSRPAKGLFQATRRSVTLLLSGLLAALAAMAQSAGGPSMRPPAPSGPSGLSAAAPRTDRTYARSAFQAGRKAEQSGDWKTAFAAYTEAAANDPASSEYAILKEHARFQVIQGIVDSAERQAVAGNISEARALLQQALAIDPSYSVAQERLAELTTSPQEAIQDNHPKLAGLPRLIFKSGARDFDYRGTTRGAYEEIGRQFGVTMVFDTDLPDRQVRFQVPGVDYETAVMVLSRQTRTFTRVVDAHTVFITEDSPQKVREYALEVEKDLMLPAAVTSDEMNEAVRMIREMTGITRTQLNTATRTLTVRSTEQNIAVAEALLGQIEQPHGELMLEVEILEVDRTAAHQLGIIPPSSVSVFALTLPEIRQLQAAQNNGTLIQILQSIFGSSAVSSATGSALPALIAFGGGKTIFLGTMPGVTANFSQALSAVRGAQRILLRAQDAKPATFFVGDRYPVSLGLLSANISPQNSALAQGVLSGSLPRTDYTTGNGPSAVAVADFNGDGHLDMAVANQTDGTISILQGNGDGTFVIPATSCAAPPTNFPGCMQLPSVTSGTTTTAASPSAIATGDFNNDGNLDIAVTDSANNLVYILLGNGDGTFKKNPASYSTGTKPIALVAQDFDADSQADLAVVNQGDGKTASTVSVLLGNKTSGKQDGTFATKVDHAVGIDPTAIATADFTGKGIVDLAVANHATGTGGDGTVSILLGNGDGTFGTQTTFAAGNGPAGIATADFNGDGHADLAVANQADGTASILLGKGDGTFSAHTDFNTGSGPTGIVAANFTGTNTDLAVADSGANSAGILIGNGDGTFLAPVSLPTGNSPVAVATGAFVTGGATDLVAANNASKSVTVYINTLQSSSSSPSNQTAYPSAEYVDLGLKVKATPRLHADDEVTLQLQFDIKSLAGSSVNGIPILTNRSIEQTVRLRDGETSVLSGLIERNESRTMSGLPWTSTLPGIGLLTGEETTNNQDTELLIIVTPHALRLPPHDVPAIYAGRGEPATPPGPVAPVPGPPVPPGAQPGGLAPTPPGQAQPGGPGQLNPPSPEQPGPPGSQPGRPPGRLIPPQPQPQQ